MSTRAFITGVSGTQLTAAERALVRAAGPRVFNPFRLSMEISIQATVLFRELVSMRLIAGDLASLSIPVDGAANPTHRATTSATMIAQVIRGAIGFQGLLMSHDVPMKALAGSIGKRSRAMFAAGAPLHSNDNAELDALTTANA